MAEKDKKKDFSDSFNNSTGESGIEQGIKNAKDMLTGMFSGGDEEAGASEKLKAEKNKKKN